MGDSTLGVIVIEPLVLFVPLIVVTVAGIIFGIKSRRMSHSDSWLEEVVRRRLLVHTRDGQTLDGQLARVDADGLVLSPAKLEGEYDLGGEVWVPRERVGWAQHPPAEGSEE